MKLKHYLLIALSVVALSSCYNDNKLWEEVNSQSQRIEALEDWQKVVNNNIEALQALINTSDFVTGVIPIMLERETIGYTIAFKNSDPISIYNGSNGENGENGKDGKDGTTPVVSLTQSENHNWYWTLNGELMTDSQGNPIQANGKDGMHGSNGENGKDAPLPLLKTGNDVPSTVMADIENKPIYKNAFYLSVDGGNTWARVSGKDGSNGVSGYSPFTSVTDQGDYIEIKMNNQDITTLKLYKESQMKVIFETMDGVIKINSFGTITIPYTVENQENNSWIQFEGTNGLIVLKNSDETITLLSNELRRSSSSIIISIIRNDKIISKSRIEVVLLTALSELDNQFFTTSPETLEILGGKVPVTIRGRFPQQWFVEEAVVEVTPVLKWSGGEARGLSYTFQGERVKGNNEIIPFYEGGSYTMKSSFDYKPEMVNSKLYLDFKIEMRGMISTIPPVEIASGITTIP